MFFNFKLKRSITDLLYLPPKSSTNTKVSLVSLFFHIATHLIETDELSQFNCALHQKAKAITCSNHHLINVFPIVFQTSVEILLCLATNHFF